LLNNLLIAMAVALKKGYRTFKEFGLELKSEKYFMNIY